MNKKNLPKDAITLLEENTNHNKIKAYFATLAILFITFAIPVTLLQTFKDNTLTTSAQTTASPPSLLSFLHTTSSQTIQHATSVNIFIQYWWLFLGIGILIVIWFFLIISYLMSVRDKFPLHEVYS